MNLRYYHGRQICFGQALTVQFCDTPFPATWHSSGLYKVFHKNVAAGHRCYIERVARDMDMPDEDAASRIIVGMPNHNIEDPFLNDKILSHQETRWRSQGAENHRPDAGAPPPRGLLVATSRARMIDEYGTKTRRVGGWLGGVDESPAR